MLVDELNINREADKMILVEDANALYDNGSKKTFEETKTREIVVNILLTIDYSENTNIFIFICYRIGIIHKHIVFHLLTQETLAPVRTVQRHVFKCTDGIISTHALMCTLLFK